MILCGLDPSLNGTGYFIFDSDNLRVIDYGCIVNNKLSEGEKLLNIYNTVSAIIQKYNIQGVGIERAFHSRNTQTYGSLQHVHGTIILALTQFNISYAYYAPMTIKSKTLDKLTTKKTTGEKKTGNEMKAEVSHKMIDIFGQHQFNKSFNLDITDAASIGYCYLLMDGKEQEKKTTTKKNRVNKN